MFINYKPLIQKGLKFRYSEVKTRDFDNVNNFYQRILKLKYFSNNFLIQTTFFLNTSFQGKIKPAYVTYRIGRNKIFNLKINFNFSVCLPFNPIILCVYYSDTLITFNYEEKVITLIENQIEKDFGIETRTNRSMNNRMNAFNFSKNKVSYWRIRTYQKNIVEIVSSFIFICLAHQ